MKNNGYIITGTGTGVGKTVFTNLLYHTAINSLFFKHDQTNNKKIIALKPIQTGFNNRNLQHSNTNDIELRNKNDENDDLLYIYKNNLNIPLQKETNSYKDLIEKTMQTARSMQAYFQCPCSPHLAQIIEGKHELTVDNLLELIKPASNYNTVLVESAGGLFVPINNKGEVFAHFAQKLNFPLIIISHGGLGEINNLLLTIQVANWHGLKIAGFGFSNADINKGDCLCGNNGKVTFKEVSGDKGITSLSYILQGNTIDTFNCDKSSLRDYNWHKNKEYSKLTQDRKNHSRKSDPILCNSCFNELLCYDNAKTVCRISKKSFIGLIPNINTIANKNSEELFLINRNSLFDPIFYK